MSISSRKLELPRFIDARKLVRYEQQLAGVVLESALPRLVASVEAVVGDVYAELRFAQDYERNLTVNGRLQLQIQRICQRCLQPVSENLEAEFAWGIVWTENQGEKLPKFLDPVVQFDDELNLYQVLEDEILLSLPAMAYHDEECVDRDKFSSADTTRKPGGSAENPFKVLEQLKVSSSRS